MRENQNSRDIHNGIDSGMWRGLAVEEQGEIRGGGGGEGMREGAEG